MDSNKRMTLIAIGLFLGTVIVVLLVLRGGALWTPDTPATRLPLSDCDLQQGACSASLPDGGSLTLAFDPHPVRPMQDFSLRLEATDIDVNEALISFTGVDMNMGLNRFVLKPNGNALSGKAILPVCVRNRMEWEARLRISTPKGVFELPFRFATSKQ